MSLSRFFEQFSLTHTHTHIIYFSFIFFWFSFLSYIFLHFLFVFLFFLFIIYSVFLLFFLFLFLFIFFSLFLHFFLPFSIINTQTNTQTHTHTHTHTHSHTHSLTHRRWIELLQALQVGFLHIQTRHVKARNRRIHRLDDHTSLESLPFGVCPQLFLKIIVKGKICGEGKLCEREKEEIFISSLSLSKKFLLLPSFLPAFLPSFYFELT